MPIPACPRQRGPLWTSRGKRHAFPPPCPQVGGCPQASQHPAARRMNLISGKGETSSRLPAFSLFLPGSCPNYRDRRCKRNIEMTPLCKIEVTHPRVLGSREVRRGGGVDEQALEVSRNRRSGKLRMCG